MCEYGNVFSNNGCFSKRNVALKEPANEIVAVHSRCCGKSYGSAVVYSYRFNNNAVNDERYVESISNEACIYNGSGGDRSGCIECITVLIEPTVEGVAFLSGCCGKSYKVVFLYDLGRKNYSVNNEYNRVKFFIGSGNGSVLSNYNSICGNNGCLSKCNVTLKEPAVEGIVLDCGSGRKSCGLAILNLDCIDGLAGYTGYEGNGELVSNVLCIYVSVSDYRCGICKCIAFCIYPTDECVAFLSGCCGKSYSLVLLCSSGCKYVVINVEYNGVLGSYGNKFVFCIYGNVKGDRRINESIFLKFSAINEEPANEYVAFLSGCCGKNDRGVAGSLQCSKDIHILITEVDGVFSLGSFHGSELSIYVRACGNRIVKKGLGSKLSAILEEPTVEGVTCLSRILGKSNDLVTVCLNAGVVNTVNNEGDVVLGNFNSTEDSSDLYVVCGHLVKSYKIAIGITCFPSDNGSAVIFANICKVCNVSTYGKEALFISLIATNIITDLIYIIEGNAYVNCKSEILNVKECIDEILDSVDVLLGYDFSVDLVVNLIDCTVNILIVKNLVSSLVYKVKNVSGLINGYGEYAVTVVEREYILFGKFRRYKGIEFGKGLKCLVVEILILSDLVIDLLVGEVLQLIKHAVDLVVVDYAVNCLFDLGNNLIVEGVIKHLIKVNVLKEFEYLIKRGVLYDCKRFVRSVIDLAKYLVLNSVGNSRTVSSLKNCLCKFIGNVYVQLYSTVSGNFKADVTTDKRCNLSYNALLSTKFQGDAKFGLGIKCSRNREIVRELHLVVAHLSDFLKGRNRLYNVQNSTENETLTVCGIAVKGHTVNGYVVKEFEKSHRIDRLILVFLKILKNESILIRNSLCNYGDLSIRLVKSYAEGLLKHVVELAVVCLNNNLANHIVYKSLVCGGIRFLKALYNVTNSLNKFFVSEVVGYGGHNFRDLFVVKGVHRCNHGIVIDDALDLFSSNLADNVIYVKRCILALSENLYEVIVADSVCKNGIGNSLILNDCEDIVLCNISNVVINDILVGKFAADLCDRVLITNECIEHLLCLVTDKSGLRIVDLVVDLIGNGLLCFSDCLGLELLVCLEFSLNLSDCLFLILYVRKSLSLSLVYCSGLIGSINLSLSNNLVLEGLLSLKSCDILIDTILLFNGIKCIVCTVTVLSVELLDEFLNELIVVVFYVLVNDVREVVGDILFEKFFEGLACDLKAESLKVLIDIIADKSVNTLLITVLSLDEFIKFLIVIDIAVNYLLDSLAVEIISNKLIKIIVYVFVNEVSVTLYGVNYVRYDLILYVIELSGLFAALGHIRPELIKLSLNVIRNVRVNYFEKSLVASGIHIAKLPIAECTDLIVDVFSDKGICDSLYEFVGFRIELVILNILEIFTDYDFKFFFNVSLKEIPKNVVNGIVSVLCLVFLYCFDVLGKLIQSNVSLNVIVNIDLDEVLLGANFRLNALSIVSDVLRDLLLDVLVHITVDEGVKFSLIIVIGVKKECEIIVDSSSYHILNVIVKERSEDLVDLLLNVFGSGERFNGHLTKLNSNAKHIAREVCKLIHLIFVTYNVLKECEILFIASCESLVFGIKERIKCVVPHAVIVRCKGYCVLLGTNSRKILKNNFLYSLNEEGKKCLDVTY